MSPSNPKKTHWFVKVLLTLGLLLLVLAGVIATRPADFRITRSATMSAPSAAVFAQVNNFHNWEGWSPWAKMDPNAKITYEGPAEGTGAIFRWDGNDKVGTGSNTIIESKPGELVRIKLEFLKPFAATSTADFTFIPRGDQTVVTWSMHGKNNFLAKAFSLVMDCDKMVGPDFEKGLASLKTVVEAAPKAIPAVTAQP